MVKTQKFTTEMLHSPVSVYKLRTLKLLVINSENHNNISNDLRTIYIQIFVVQIIDLSKVQTTFINR